MYPPIRRSQAGIRDDGGDDDDCDCGSRGSSFCGQLSKSEFPLSGAVRIGDINNA